MSREVFDSVIELTVLGQEFLNEGRLNASQVIADAIDHIEKLESQLQASEWTKVEDGLPENGQEVVFYTMNKYTSLGSYNDEEFWSEKGVHHSVTHWKRIDPPKEEE